MDPIILSAVITIGILVIGLAIGVDIGIILATSGLVGIYICIGRLDAAVLRTPLVQSLEVTMTYGFIVIPMFVLMGHLASATRVAEDLFNSANKWLASVRGGLAMTAVVTCAGMAAITGSSVATAIAMTKIALPELRRHGYKDELSVGTITVGGTLAIMIPPSITFVLYGIFAEQSIGQLLISGILPGIITAILYIMMIFFRCRIQLGLAPLAPRTNWGDKVSSLWGVLPFFCIIGAIMGGILFGVWTPVEASCAGCVMVALLGLGRRRLTLKAIRECIIEAVMGSASVVFLVAGAYVFTIYMALSGISEMITKAIIGWGLAAPVLFLVLVGIYLVLGCFLEPGSIMALTIPLIIPVVKSVGWNPIWFGVIFVSLMEIGMVTPPVGLNLYAVKAAQPDLPLPLIYASCTPFWICNLISIMILYLIPDIALVLPKMMLG